MDRLWWLIFRRGKEDIFCCRQVHVLVSPRLIAITKECCEQFWTSPGGNTPQDTNCTATCLLSRKLFKWDKPDMQDTAGKSSDELISDVLLWTPTRGRAKAGRTARTYIQQLCEDIGCCPEDLPEAMNDREKWRERVRDIHASSTTWWWWSWSPRGLF